MIGAFVCAVLSIVPTVRHADYLAGWLEILREDNRAIIRVASAASKAADYLLAFRDRDLDRRYRDHLDRLSRPRPADPRQPRAAHQSVRTFSDLSNHRLRDSHGRIYFAPATLLSGQ